MSRIEWTDETWNPTRGCSRVSAGCEHCYAERQAIRMSGPGGAYEGLVRLGKKGPTWTGVVRPAPSATLAAPLRWRLPRRVFVDSMSDLFHERLSGKGVGAVFGVMQACRQHTFQILTKRAARMRNWFDELNVYVNRPDLCARCACVALGLHANRLRLRTTTPSVQRATPAEAESLRDPAERWPLPNVWLGVSVEDQQRATERIPLLLETPAAVRFVSYEPALGPVDFRPWLSGDRRLDWIIIGGESGPAARPFHLAWGLDVVTACQQAGVAVFWKQMGHAAIEPLITNDAERLVYAEGADRLRLPRRSKGGTPEEWPPLFQHMGDLRQYPTPRTSP